MSISETDIAYICGWLDGEGCFSIYKQKRKGMMAGFDYTPSMSFSNTDKKVVLWVMGKLNIAETKSKPYKDRNMASGKTLWSVKITKYSELIRILPLLTKLITKKVEAEILLDFCKRRTKRWKLFRESRKRGDDGKFRKENLPLLTQEDTIAYKKLKELKKKCD